MQFIHVFFHSAGSRLDVFIWKCSSLPMRHTLRLSVEMTLFFIILFVTSGFFYFHVISDILKQKKRSLLDPLLHHRVSQLIK